MLGVREPEIYGKRTYSDLVEFVHESAKELGAEVFCMQSNYEGEIVDAIQKSLGLYDGIVINAGAYTHTSVAILDALKAVGLPTIEVHLSDINKREDFRKFSFISLYAKATICGQGFEGYKQAIKQLL